MLTIKYLFCFPLVGLKRLTASLGRHIREDKQGEVEQFKINYYFPNYKRNVFQERPRKNYGFPIEEFYRLEQQWRQAQWGFISIKQDIFYEVKKESYLMEDIVKYDKIFTGDSPYIMVFFKQIENRRYNNFRDFIETHRAELGLEIPQEEAPTDIKDDDLNPRSLKRYGSLGLFTQPKNEGNQTFKRKDGQIVHFEKLSM